LQNPAVRDQAKQTAELMIDRLASQLASRAVQDGRVDPAQALKRAMAASQVLVGGMFGRALDEPDTASKGQQALALLGRFASSAMDGHAAQEALADALRSLGQLLQDPRKLAAVKSAASALIEAAATAGAKLQQPHTQAAVKSGAGLLIEGVGQQMATLSDKPDGSPLTLEDLPIPVGR
jgi:hypothetical protein